MSILSIRNVKAARTPHTCDTCLRKIQPGEPYTRQVGTGHDDEFAVWEFCPGCIDGWTWLWSSPDAPAPDDAVDLLEWVEECGDDDPEAMRIRTGIRTQWGTR